MSSADCNAANAHPPALINTTTAIEDLDVVGLLNERL
jgi:hypothetical protein